MKNIPKLRFKEFSGEWEEKKILEIGTFLGGGTPSTAKEEYWNGSIPWISSSDLIENNIFKINIKKYITEEAISNSATKLVPKDSILIVSRVGVGKLAITKKELCTSQDFINIIPVKNMDIKYLAYNIKTKLFILINLNQGTSIKGITKKDLQEIKLNFPNLEEQEKIGNFLSSVDKKISIVEEKLNLFNQYKKGIMQKIFNQELRFKDENGNNYPQWEERKLGEIVNINKGKQLNKEFLSENDEYPVINGGILPSGYTNTYNSFANTITISEGGNSCGYVNFIKNNFWAGGHCYIIEKKENINYKYLYQILKNNETNIMDLRVGSGLPNIQKKAINEYKIKISVLLEEQEKIADFLSAIDNKIENISDNLESLKLFKKSMLQKMFV